MKLRGTYGLIAMLLTVSVHAQQLPPDQSVQLNKAMSNLNGANLQQGLAMAVLLGCTEKQAGKEQTEAFYAKMQAVGQQARTLCKAQQTEQARALVIQAFRDNQHDPVVAAANDCYAKNRDAITAMAGPQAAPDIAKYLHLLHDPGSIEQEVSQADVCRKK